MTTATAARKTDAPKPVPVPNGDFYQLAELLTPDETALVKKVRTYHGDQGQADHQQVLVR